MITLAPSASVTLHPLSSDRQHLSYGVCLEVRGEIIMGRDSFPWIEGQGQRSRLGLWSQF